MGLWYHPAYIPSFQQNLGIQSKYIFKRLKKSLGKLRQDLLIFSKDLHLPAQISWNDLALFHDADYLRSTANGNNMLTVLGHSLSFAEGESLIESQRRMAQATLEAALAVFHHQYQVGFNIGGGFHHAQKDQGQGFCLFNDVAVAVRGLRHQGCQQRILIIDLDYHQGNGNLVGLADDPQLFHFLINGATWYNGQSSQVKEINLLPGTDDQTYLTILEKELPAAIESFSPKIVFYIAGTDVLSDDPMGDFCLSVEGLFKRDKMVMELLKNKNIPTVITTGGGYGENSWKGIYNLLYWALANRTPTINSLGNPNRSDLESRYQRLAKKLNLSLLSQDDSQFGERDLTEEEILESLGKNRKNNKILEYYGRSGLELALEQYGFFELLKNRGHSSISFEVIPRGWVRHLLRIYSHQEKQKYLLIETQLSKHVIKENPFNQRPLKLINVEWLLSQDPLASFSLDRPQLPGQRYPGLHLSKEIHQLLVQACRRLSFDGLVYRPSHYHIALKACRDFKYLRPQMEGQFLAMKNYLRDYSLLDASIMVERGDLKTLQGEKITLPEGPFLLPVSTRLLDYFASANYLQECTQNMRRQLSENWTLSSSCGHTV